MTPQTSTLPRREPNRPTRWSAALAVAVLAATAAVAPTHAAPAVLQESVSAADARNDVRIFHRVPGLSLSARKSIDLRGASVAPRTGHVRFTVHWREVLRGRRLDQMAFFTLTPPAGSNADWTASLGFSAQRPAISYAGLSRDSTGSDYESCDPIKATVLRRTDRVRLDVPNRCIPSGLAKIDVTTLTGHFRSDSPAWSRDRLRFPVPVVLR